MRKWRLFLMWVLSYEWKIVNRWRTMKLEQYFNVKILNGDITATFVNFGIDRPFLFCFSNFYFPTKKAQNSTFCFKLVEKTRGRRKVWLISWRNEEWFYISTLKNSLTTKTRKRQLEWKTFSRVSLKSFLIQQQKKSKLFILSFFIFFQRRRGATKKQFLKNFTFDDFGKFISVRRV